VGGKGFFLWGRPDFIFAMRQQRGKEMPHGVAHAARVRVEVAANYGAERAFLRAIGVGVRAEKGDDFFDLLDTALTGTVIEVQVDNRQSVAADDDFGVEKAFFAEQGGAEGVVFPKAHGMARKDGIAVGQRLAAPAAVVDAEVGVRKTGFLAQRFEQVDVLVPVRAFVHFLQGDDVRAGFSEEPPDFLQIGVDALRGVEALIERQTAPVGDIECHQGQAGHEGRMKKGGWGMK